tara:strand:- start:21382 stop:22596 length:1215 start_codon:yes stop_codon:yes gene_type:complete
MQLKEVIMDSLYMKKAGNIGFFTVLIWFLTTIVTFGQSDKVTLEFSLSPILEQAQVLGLSSLGVDTEGGGPVIISGSLVNNTTERLENLYFEFDVEAASYGVLARIRQQAAYPFSLSPGQVIFATNNDIQNEEIPGIPDRMKFDGGLTSTGENFVEDLSGTTLPNDQYSFAVRIYQVTEEGRREILANETIQLGGNILDGGVVDELTILLRTPGDLVGAEAAITNPIPQLSWEGDASLTYRVLVVSGNGSDSPESLLESAKSSEATDMGGSLLQFEYLDQNIRGNSLQYPTNGVQALVPGQTYYWQVVTSMNTALGLNEVVSEIWEFTLVDPGSESNVVEVDQETVEALVQLVGQDTYNLLLETGYNFENIEIDGQVYTGVIGVQKILELIEKFQNGDLVIEGN